MSPSTSADPAGADAGALVAHDRAAAVRAGLWPTLAVALAVVVYALGADDSPHPVALAVVAATALAGSLLAAALPRLRGAGRAGAGFAAWSAGLIAAITAGAALDGGADSPLAALLFLPLTYAALAYPPRAVLLVVVGCVGAYLGLAVGDGAVLTPRTSLVAVALAAAGWLCAWLARRQEEHRSELAALAATDALTGVLNRRGFEQRLRDDLALAAREGRQLTLVVLDLDGFKAVNDSRGHAAGDAVLRDAAAALRAALRPSDTVGRLGGDEFAVVVHAPTDVPAHLVDRLTRLLARSAPASAGVARFPADGASADALHRVADARLYAHKRARRAAAA